MTLFCDFRAAVRTTMNHCGGAILFSMTIMLLVPVSHGQTSSTEATPRQTLTLVAATRKALADAPELLAEANSVLGAEGAAIQAGYRPNPELGLEAENLAGSGPYNALEGTVYTLSVSQKLELGNKRQHRKSVARERISGARLRLADERLTLIKNVRVAYMRVISAQEQLRLAQEHYHLAQALLQEIEKRVQAARAPALQLSKAQIALATAGLAVAELERELQHSHHVLASFWRGGHEPHNYDSAPFFELEKPVTEEQLQESLPQHPTVAYWQVEHQRQQALLQLEKAHALPDPKIALGVRRFQETEDQALVLGVSMPLPLFDRNQGNVRQASAELARSLNEEEAALRALTAEGLQALEDAVNSHARAVTFSTTIIPAAERAFVLAREGYTAGRFPYLEVLDAERTLFDAKQSYVSALTHYQEAQARVQYAMAMDSLP